MYKSKVDGKEFNNPQIGAYRDKAMGGMAKPEQAPMESHGEPMPEGGDIHEVVGLHGPASQVSMRREGEGIHVLSVHGGHHHEQMHGSMDEAMNHARTAFGEHDGESHHEGADEIQGGKMRSSMAEDSSNAPIKSALVGL